MISFKEYVNILDKTTILQEGGLAGHMSHLYDNWDLSFKTLKQILTDAAQGKLYGTEKVDGINIYVSYSVKEGKAKAARNKDNIKQGGLDAQQLAAKFENRGHLKDAFIDAFDIFEKAVQSLSREQQTQIFGPDADIYYNAEIVDPRNANVLNYDKKTLLIHQVGHIFFDKQAGSIVDVDLDQNKKALDRALQIMQDAIQDSEYQIITNAVKQLGGLSDNRILNNTLNQINQLQNDAGINDNQTIGDYVNAKITKFINTQLQKYGIVLSNDQISALILRSLGKGGANITQIAKGLPKEMHQLLKQISDEGINLVKKIIFPLEEIIHNFAVEMLRGLQSVYIIDPVKEIKRIQKELSKSIQQIQNSSNEAAHEILKKQLQKLKSVENFKSAIEGFVFNYDGHTYKFTGNFAPVNALMGLFRYSKVK